MPPGVKCTVAGRLRERIFSATGVTGSTMLCILRSTQLLHRAASCLRYCFCGLRRIEGTIVTIVETQPRKEVEHVDDGVNGLNNCYFKPNVNLQPSVSDQAGNRDLSNTSSSASRALQDDESSY